MPRPTVTFVIATYKRVDALKCTLRSVQLQGHRDWNAIVIGDRCGEDTFEAIRSLGETRIAYYNLPERFGEQSGPNSAGLALATGDFVSFLNHDDLLLGDHVEYALEVLAAGGSDFFIGESANATLLRTLDDGTVVPVFTEVIPAKKDMTCLIHPSPYIFDPSSFWLVRTPYAKAVGPWKPAMELWRTPLRDWTMRAWRMGGKFSFGNRITGLRFWTQNLRDGAPLYASTTPEHEYMIDRFLTESPDEIRRFLLDQIGEANERNLRASGSGHPFPSARMRECLRKILANGYFWLGIDPVNLMNRLLGRPKGGVLSHITRRRTGEDLGNMQRISGFLRDPESYRLL